MCSGAAASPKVLVFLGLVYFSWEQRSPFWRQTSFFLGGQHTFSILSCVLLLCKNKCVCLSSSCSADQYFTCSPAHRCTPSSSSCSPGLTACSESSCVFSSGPVLHTDGQTGNVSCGGSFRLTLRVYRAALPWWGAAGWTEWPPPLPGASSHLHWGSAPGQTFASAGEAVNETWRRRHDCWLIMSPPNWK